MTELTRSQSVVTAATYLTIYAATGDFMRTITVGSLIAALILIAWETADLLANDLRRITHTADKIERPSSQSPSTL